MKNIFSIFIMSCLLFAPSVGYSQLQLWCADGDYYKLWIGCTNNNERLLRSAFLGDLESVESFLDAGASVNYQDELGRTALMHASFWGYLEVVRFLLDNGADVNLKDYREETAYWYAWRTPYGVSLEDKNKVLILLREAGVVDEF